MKEKAKPYLIFIAVTVGIIVIPTITTIFSISYLLSK